MRLFHVDCFPNAALSALLGNIKIEDYNLSVQRRMAGNIASRVLRALVMLLKSPRVKSPALRTALELSKCYEAGLCCIVVVRREL